MTGHEAHAELASLAQRASRGEISTLGGPHLLEPHHASSFRHAAVLLLFTPTHDRAEPHEAPAAPGVDLFLVQRAPWLRHHPGQIALPGGGVETGDASMAATALRETHEEIGVAPERVEVVGQLPQVALPISSNVVTPVLGWSDAPGCHGGDDGAEVLHTLRVPVAKLLAPDSRATVTIYGGQSMGFALDASWVWGFTGNLLDHVFTELGWTQPWPHEREYRMSLDEAVGAQLPPATPRPG